MFYWVNFVKRGRILKSFLTEEEEISQWNFPAKMVHVLRPGIIFVEKSTDNKSTNVYNLIWIRQLLKDFNSVRIVYSDRYAFLNLESDNQEILDEVAQKLEKFKATPVVIEFVSYFSIADESQLEKGDGFVRLVFDWGDLVDIIKVLAK